MDETIRLDDLHGKIGSESVVQECILLYIYIVFIHSFYTLLVDTLFFGWCLLRQLPSA